MKLKHPFEIKDIYPDPADTYFTFTFSSGNGITTGKLMVSICNQAGRILIQKEFENLTSYTQNTIKTGALNNGLYDVVFCLGDEMITQKINILQQSGKIHDEIHHLNPCNFFIKTEKL